MKQNLKPAFIFSSGEGGLGNTTMAGFLIETIREKGAKIGVYDITLTGNLFGALSTRKTPLGSGKSDPQIESALWIPPCSSNNINEMWNIPVRGKDIDTKILVLDTAPGMFGSHFSPNAIRCLVRHFQTYGFRAVFMMPVLGYSSIAAVMSLLEAVGQDASFVLWNTPLADNLNKYWWENLKNRLSAYLPHIPHQPVFPIWLNYLETPLSVPRFSNDLMEGVLSQCLSTQGRYGFHQVSEYFKSGNHSDTSPQSSYMKALTWQNEMKKLYQGLKQHIGNTPHKIYMPY